MRAHHGHAHARERDETDRRALTIALLLIGGFVVVELVAGVVAHSLALLADAGHLSGGLVLAVALAGIAVNLAATVALSRASRESLNVRGAFLHAASDLAAFVGTALAGAIVLATGWNRADPIASLVVAGLMFFAAWSLLRDTTRIFLEMSPQEIDPADVGSAIVSIPHVVKAHDLHVWTVSTGSRPAGRPFGDVFVEAGEDLRRGLTGERGLPRLRLGGTAAPE